MYEKHEPMGGDTTKRVDVDGLFGNAGFWKPRRIFR